MSRSTATPAKRHWRTASAAATEALGAETMRHLPELTAPFVIELHGDLGAGKTTWARGALLALGASPPIKSPSYTLLEPYRCGDIVAVHLDLYRVRDATELDNLALRDYHAARHVWLIEWPARGAGFLPAPDLVLTFEYAVQERYISAVAQSVRGHALLDGMPASAENG